MRKEVFNYMLKLYLSLIIGVTGILLLSFSFLYFYGASHPFTIPGKMANVFIKLLYQLPPFLATFLSIPVSFGFLIFLFLSPIGIFLGNKAYKSTKQNLAVFAIVLNIINLIVSVFIGWLVYGLSTGAM